MSECDAGVFTPTFSHILLDLRVCLLKLGYVPRLQYITATWLTRHAVPLLLHPPLITTSRNTACAEFFLHITQSGTMTTTNPSKWPNKDSVSSIGNILAPHVLKKIVMTTNASMINVYCQLGNPKLAFVTSIIACIMVVTTKALLATLASQPSVDIQPDA